MESALRTKQLGIPKLGRYSFLAVDPFDLWQVSRRKADPFADLAQKLTSYRLPNIPGLPPFQGGAAGVLGYEFGRCFEKIPKPKHDEFSLPMAVMGLYDLVLAWDHESEDGWLISSGLPESNEKRRAVRSKERAEQLMERLRGPSIPRPSPLESPQATAHGLTAPQFDTRLGPAWLGNFDSRGYRQAVQQAIDYIYAGDIFQVNLSQRLMRRSLTHAVDLYLKLREVNAAPFAGYFDLGVAQVVSASPERFLKMNEGLIETRPIKGTRPRTGNENIDRLAAEDLKGSRKDNAENVMIVDLLRNDLSRVCDLDSMRVAQLCQVENYPYVMHLVSAIEGRLAKNHQVTDLLAATFPGGSITGAPKIRAMEIIAELEPTARGPYCGSLGYLGFNGSVDTNILIRTITASRGWWQLQVGGGIVANSRPESEEEETWTKAAGIVATIDRMLAQQ